MTYCLRMMLAAVVAAMGVSGALRAADPAATGPSGTQPATQAAEDGHWRDVLAQLGSTAFSEREEAQKELDKLTYKQMDLLKQMATQATDAEVKSRLLNRITQIEEELAYSPPPISFDVQNGSISDVAEALGKALGTHMESWPPRNMGAQNGDPWTLSVKEKPFWDVVLELEKQGGFTFQDYDNQFRLMQQGPGLRKGLVSGGLCMFPQSITRSRTADLQQEAGNQAQPEQMLMSFMAVLDPRVALANSMAPEFTSVVDDLGNVLYQAPAAAGPLNWNNFGGRPAHMWNQSISLQIPQKPGKKIVSAQGRLRLLVQLAADKLEVEDMDKKLNTPFIVGGKTVTFQQFEPQPDNNSVRFQMQIAGPARNNQPGAGLNPANALVTVSYIDSNGKYIWGQTIQGSSGGSFGGQFVPPLKVVLSVPTKLKEVTIPFDLKDLPLP